jgi:hypothetical protein
LSCCGSYATALLVTTGRSGQLRNSLSAHLTEKYTNNLNITFDQARTTSTDITMAMERNVRDRKGTMKTATRQNPGRNCKTVTKSKTATKTKAPTRKSKATISTLPTITPQWPAPSHGRQAPYQPTTQVRGYYPKERGNPPPGINPNDWNKTYNNADCWVRARFPKATEIADAKRERENGSTRDVAIERLILRGVLPANFIDALP